MTNAARWSAILILILLALSLVGMIAYARGQEHHRGDEAGSQGASIVVVQPRG